MVMFDNQGSKVIDDLRKELTKGSKVSIASACFSMYAFEALRKELEQIEELRFIFTSPTFISENTPKEKREFYIPKLDREKSLYGSEFEIKLRNALTQKAIAKECADWIRRKVKFKSNTTMSNTSTFFAIQNKEKNVSYMPFNSFTTVDLGLEKGNNLLNYVNKLDTLNTLQLLKGFENLWNNTNTFKDVTENVLESISTAYKENSPSFIYYVTLYHIFNEFLDDISEDVLPNEATGFKTSCIWNLLYNFQKDAALAIINKLEKYNGCILADSVGLGKTYTALSVIKYYENRNKNVLVLCPKKLVTNWNTYKANYKNNPVAADRLRYDVLFHTDLTRETGTSNGIELDRLIWSNYDLIVIDESHNFRNGGKITDDDEQEEKENRYQRLLKRVIREGVKTKVLMLSATPVNNRFFDLKNQLQLAYEGDSSKLEEKLNISHPIEQIFREAQKAFNIWSKYKPEERTTEKLLQMLDFDFFELLDSVTIARSRKHIEKYYNTEKIGKFPTRLKPLSLRPAITDFQDTVTYNAIFASLMKLTLSVYTPTRFILPSKKEKYAELYKDESVNKGFTQENREYGIRRLTSINLMKRLESSVYAFRLTLERILQLIENNISMINTYKNHANTEISLQDISEELENQDFDLDDENDDSLFAFGRSVKLNLADMDYESWAYEMQRDKEVLQKLLQDLEEITPENDSKLQQLFYLLHQKIEKPINADNKKVIIFTAFADTATYLYEHVSQFVKEQFQLETALVTGSIEGKTTLKNFSPKLNDVLTCFSPLSKERELLMPNCRQDIDILIATDCISEGQNLQDCDYLINYDIHWNPVRIIQRFGRIDRIGSKNTYIQLVNFWPDITLDEYINLKAKVETKMKIVDMTATGDENILSENEKIDLEYRKIQLQRLQEEVVDMEDMLNSISIMDLGLNEFRLDLLDYLKNNEDLKRIPFGLHAIAPKKDDTEQGVIFILKNHSHSVNIQNQNRLHPFYMVYVDNAGNIVCDHLNPKKLLDTMRHLCKEHDLPIKELTAVFNKETNDGKNMQHYSDLLNIAISSLIKKEEDTQMLSLLKGNAVSLLAKTIKGLDDFELVTFLVVQ